LTTLPEPLSISPECEQNIKGGGVYIRIFTKKILSPTQSVAKKTFFNQPAQRAGAFRNFSKSSRSVQERFETFQNLPAACRNASKLFKVFPQRAGAFRNFSKSSRSVQEHFETFQSLPAACRNRFTQFKHSPQQAGVSKTIIFPSPNKKEYYVNK
jgi:hypothetical protein